MTGASFNEEELRYISPRVGAETARRSCLGREQTLELISNSNKLIRKSNPRIGQFSPYSLYGTDAGHIVNKLNIPGFVMGSGGKYNTQPDERVSLRDYIDNIKLYCVLSIGLLDKKYDY